MPKPSPGPRILSFHDGVAVAQVGPLCVVIWREAVTPQRFERQRAGLEKVLEDREDGAGFLCVIEPTSAPPDDALRRASTQMVETHADRLKCVAVVIEGEGFRAAITRSVISGMALLLPRRIQATAFSTVRDALVWIARYLPVTPIDRTASLVEWARGHLNSSSRSA